MNAVVHGRSYTTVEQVAARVREMITMNETWGVSDGRVTELNALESLYTIYWNRDRVPVGVFASPYEAEDHYWGHNWFMGVDLPTIEKLFDIDLWAPAIVDSPLTPCTTDIKENAR